MYTKVESWVAPATHTATRLTPAKPAGLYTVQVPRLSSEAEAHELVQSVASNASTWHELSTVKRVELLEAVRTRIIKSSLKMGAAMAKVHIAIAIATAQCERVPLYMVVGIHMLTTHHTVATLTVGQFAPGICCSYCLDT
jgi:acyl-CoA reductase-like NAD-dependent aldehyde dehydrogenase